MGLASQKYYPFGRERSVSSLGTDKLFTGHQKEGDLYFMKARFYDPGLGRFLSADTIVPELANPQSLNRYSYVYNNPMVYTDPTGHDAMGPISNEVLCRNGVQSRCGVAEPAAVVELMVRAALTSIARAAVGQVSPFSFCGPVLCPEGAADAALEWGDRTERAARSLSDLGFDISAFGWSNDQRRYLLELRLLERERMTEQELWDAAVLGGAMIGSLSLVDMSRSAGVVVRNHLTGPARSLQKHGDPSNKGRSGAFPATRGSAKYMNQTAQLIVDEILFNPRSKYREWNHPKFGPVVEVTAPDGRGVLYYATGKWISFRE